MSRDETKLDLSLTSDQLSEYLKNLALKLEDGRLEIPQAGIVREGPFEIKGTVKRKDSDRTIKLKLELTSSQASPDSTGETTPEKPDPKMPYKKLKKEMQKSFKDIRKSLETGTVPSAELLDGFVDYCRKMVSYPDKGDEFYQAFLEKAEELSRAQSRGDAADLSRLADDLDQLKKSCHSRYK